MPLFGLIELGLQIYCIVHCIRTRRSTWWIFLILFVPIIGVAVYFITEMWPDIQRRQGYARGTHNANPLRYRPARKASVNQLRENLEFSNTIQNKENLADELMRQEEYGEALRLYEECLQGASSNDVGILFKLAEAAFCHEAYELSIETLHKVRALSDFRGGKVKLLLARAYAATGDSEKADQQFKQAVDKHSDLEIRYRYAEFLHDQQRISECKMMLTAIENRVKQMPPHARKLNKTWISRARKAQKALS